MEPTYLVFNCRLEGRQLREGEQGLLAAREVVQAICDADFRDHSLDLVNPNNRSSLDVLIDTRMYPNYILIEKDQHRAKDSYKLAKIIQLSFNKAAESYGWNLKMKKSCLNEIYAASIFSAMAYADSLPSCVSQNVMIENNFQGNIKQLQING